MIETGPAGECPAPIGANNPGNEGMETARWAGVGIAVAAGAHSSPCDFAAGATTPTAPAIFQKPHAKRTERGTAFRNACGSPTTSVASRVPLTAFKSRLTAILHDGRRAPAGLSAFSTPAALDGARQPQEDRTAAAQSAAGFCSPSPTAHMRPSPDAGAFFAPASDGRGPNALRRAVRGSRKARRSVGRSANRVPSATLFCSGLADSTTYGVQP